jgi:hypothetical protein
MSARGRIAAGDMNQLTEAGIPAWKMLAEALDLPIAKVRELSEQGVLSSELMIQALDKAASDPRMAKAAEGMATSWNAGISNMMDGVNMFIGGALRPQFEALTQQVVAVGKWLTTSQEAKVVQAQLTVAVQALFNTLGPVVQQAFEFGRALAQVASALPIFAGLRKEMDAVAASVTAVSAKAPAEELASGFQETATNAANAAQRMSEIRTELAAIPKEVVGINDQLEAAEADLKRNAQAIRENSAALAGVKAEADKVRDSYDAQITAVEKQVSAIERSRTAVKQQIEDTKAAYEAQLQAVEQQTRQVERAQAEVKRQIQDTKEAYAAQLEPLQAQQRQIEQTQGALKRLTEDIKQAFEDALAPLEQGLKATEQALQDNKRQADEVKRAYDAQLEPLEAAYDALKRQYDVQRQQEDLSNKIRSAELQRQKIAAMGDPIARAEAAARIDALEASKDDLELQKRLEDLNKKAEDGKLSGEERAILEIDRQILSERQRLNGMVDKGALAQVKAAEAALDAAKDQQDIERAQQDLALAQQKAGIDAVKAERDARLSALGDTRAALQAQADQQKAQIDALKGELEATLAPLEARARILARQHEDIATAIQGVKQAEQNALAPLEARGRELDRQQAMLKQQAQDIKAAEEAALAPLEARAKELERQHTAAKQRIDDLKAAEQEALAPILARQQAIEKAGQALDAERTRLQGIKSDTEAALAAAEQRLGVLQRELTTIQDQAKASETMAQQGKDIASGATAMRDFSAAAMGAGLALQEVGSFLGPATAGFLAFRAGLVLAGIAAGTVTLAMNPIILLAALIGLAVAGLALAWSKNWFDIQGKTQAVADWLTTTALPAIQGFLTNIQTAAQPIVDWWTAIAWPAIQAAAQAFLDWWSGTAWPFIQEMWANFQLALANPQAAWETFWTMVQTFAATKWEEVTRGFKVWLLGIQFEWNLWNAERTNAWNTFWTGLLAPAQAAWEGLKQWLGGALAEVGKMWNDFLASLPKFQLPFGLGGGGGTSLGGGEGTRAGRYRNEIQRASMATGVPADVIAAILETENSGEGSVSPAGARGIMQVVPGQGYDLPGEDWRDPATSIMQGARALADKQRATGDWDRAMAAYFGYGTDAGGMTTNRYLEQARANRAKFTSFGNANVLSEQVNQMTGFQGVMSYAEMQAACGPAAALWFAQTYGRPTTPAEAARLSREVGWDSVQGMGGPANFQRLAGALGVPTTMDWTPTAGEANAMAAAGQPFAISTGGTANRPGHYYQVSGQGPGGTLDVGASGLVAGGKEFMTIGEIEALSGKMQALISITADMGAEFQNTGVVTQEMIDRAAALGVTLPQTAAGAGVLAQAAGIVAAEEATWAAQQANLQALLSQQTPTVQSASAALQQMAGAVAPLFVAVDQGAITTEQLTEQLVTLAANTGLATDPLEQYRLGNISLSQAMNEVLRAASLVDPAFAEMTGPIAVGTEATGAMGDAFFSSASGMLNLLGQMAKTPGAAATVAGALPAATGAIGATGAAAVTAGQQAGTWQQQMLEVTQQILAAVQKMSEDMKATFEQMASMVKSQLDSLKGQVEAPAEAIGESISEGIAEGIDSNAGAISEAAHDAVQEAMDEVREIEGIASPSKRWAKLVGAPLGQGIAVGLRASQGEISDALRGLTSPDGLDLPGVSVSRSGHFEPGGTGRVTVDIDYDRLASALERVRGEVRSGIHNYYGAGTDEVRREVREEERLRRQGIVLGKRL